MYICGGEVTKKAVLIFTNGVPSAQGSFGKTQCAFAFDFDDMLIFLMSYVLLRMSTICAFRLSLAHEIKVGLTVFVFITKLQKLSSSSKLRCKESNILHSCI